MTNKQAIEILNRIRCVIREDSLEEQALVYAIEALEKQALVYASEALKTQDRQLVAQKKRYTFGNDEFSLGAAYHDCKLVFDGITDDDSFQEADTGLILYYANEIIYALQETLQPEQQTGGD